CALGPPPGRVLLWRGCSPPVLASDGLSLIAALRGTRKSRDRRDRVFAVQLGHVIRAAVIGGRLPGAGFDLVLKLLLVNGEPLLLFFRCPLSALAVLQDFVLQLLRFFIPDVDVLLLLPCRSVRMLPVLCAGVIAVGAGQ